MLSPAYERRWLHESGLFDAPFYLTLNPDVAAAGFEPHWHFCTHGWREGRLPNRYFSPAWYQANNHCPADINPLLHYGLQGEAQGLKPSPWFDPAWYALANGLAPGQSALATYLHRSKSGFSSPCPELYAVPYLEKYRAAQPDPFLAYIEDTEAGIIDDSADAILLRASGLIDDSAYMIDWPDILSSGSDAVSHYCRYGWREGRNPNSYFNTTWYLATNPEVKRLGLNPLTHYLVAGERAGRRPTPYFDPKWYRNNYAIGGRSPLAHYLANRRSQTYSPIAAFDVLWYVTQHRHQIGKAADPFQHYLLLSAQNEAIHPHAGFTPPPHGTDEPSDDLNSGVKDHPFVRQLRQSYR
jgi:hypothetical protein